MLLVVSGQCMFEVLHVVEKIARAFWHITIAKNTISLFVDINCVGL